VISLWGLRSRKSRTRKAFGSTGNTLATFDNAELPFAHLYIVEAENTVLVFLNEGFNPLQGMIRSLS